jgi:four helix bundle protein
MSRFLHIAYGSASEVEYHLLLAHDLGLLTDGQFKVMEENVDEVQRMLTALIRTVRSGKSTAFQN